MKMKNAKCKMKNYDRGVSLLLAILIMSLVLGISLGISTILVQQTKITREMGESVIALSAADTAIEKVAMDLENPVEFQECFSPPYNDICYEVKVFTPGPNCEAGSFCLRAIGSYKAVKRAIELKY